MQKGSRCDEESSNEGRGTLKMKNTCIHVQKLIYAQLCLIQNFQPNCIFYNC